jgi:competence protein ComEA
MTRNILLASTLVLVSAAATAASAVNINTASAERMAAELNGVGEVRAQAIVDYRQNEGAFPSVGALSNVKGIGPATLSDNRGNMTVEGSQ